MLREFKNNKTMMRKFIIISAVIFGLLGIIFTILPLGTIAFIPIGITFILSGIAIQKSKNSQRKLPKIVMFVSVLTFLVVIGKVIFIKDVIKMDKQFELKKEESKKEDIKDLEGL
jgi:4-hydroxybenzoate polyprenyltransferase